MLILATAVMTVAASACGPEADSRSGPPPTAGAAVSSAAPQPSASAQGCSDESPVTNTASGNGTALRVGGLKQYGSGSSWNIALPDGGPERVPN